MTATELDGPTQKPLGNSELSSSVCNRLLLLLWLKSWPLERLRFALNLVLNASFHMHRNEPFLRREQDGRSGLLPGGRCQHGSNLAEVGKEEMLSACPTCPQPPAPASFQILLPSPGQCAVPCPGEANWKMWEDFRRGKARDWLSVLICCSVRYAGGRVFCFAEV